MFIRNSVVSRLDVAIDTINNATNLIHEFVEVPAAFLKENDAS